MSHEIPSDALKDSNVSVLRSEFCACCASPPQETFKAQQQNVRMFRTALHIYFNFLEMTSSDNLLQFPTLAAGSDEFRIDFLLRPNQQ